MKVIVSRQADRDLLEVYNYFYPHNPRYAERLAADLIGAIAKLSAFPSSGTPRWRVAPGIRSVQVRPYLIFYEVRTSHIEILRVLHGSRDIENEFS
jgi:toxin ParE1/3/4